MPAFRMPRHYRFPEPAGSHQAAGNAARLLRELGDNYHRYHQALAEELERCGSIMPDPAAYPPERFDEWAEQTAYRQELIVAESLLRDCARARKAPGVEAHHPLVDERHRLVSAHPATEDRGTRTGDQAAARWIPPLPPSGHPL